MVRFRTLAILFALPLAAASAQQPAAAAQAAVRVTTTSVSRVTLVRINTGQMPAYNRDMVENLIPIYEAYKAAGIITSYSLFNKATTEDANDWQRGVMLTYANWAALDGLGAKTDPITLKHYGSAEKRNAAGQARTTIATTISSFLTTGQSYTR